MGRFTWPSDTGRLEAVLEVLGFAVGLTLVQMIVLYLLLAVDLFDRYNVFLIYRAFFERFLFVFNALYFLFVNIMYRLFGGSYLHVPGFNNVFKLTFFTIFLVNLIYFATRGSEK
ncbi:MAG: hypothetical protein V3T58_07665 [Candidatus Hydrothermarchaeales archaeon]